MQTVYLLRHGVAEQENFLQSDSGRALTQQGRDDITRLGQWLKSKNISFSVVITSPYDRTRQTTEIIAAEVQYSKSIIKDERATPTGDYQRLYSILEDFQDFDDVLLVSHQPGLGRLASQLCANGNLLSDVRPGAMFAISIELQRPLAGALRWFMTPHLL